MKREWFVKTLALGVVFLFLGVGAVSALNINTIKKSALIYYGSWLYVGGSGPGNYSNIQDAIDNASDGDIIFVYNGIYELDGTIIINKSIELIGENNVNTIINNGGIFTTVSDVSISSFTIQNGMGIIVWSDFGVPSNNNIYDNIFKLDNYSVGWGGVMIFSTYNDVSDNSFFNCGLWVLSYPNFVYNNMVNGKPLVYLEYTSDIVINEAGQVILVGCNNIKIENLELYNTNIAIQLLDTTECIISKNVLMNNSILGISIINSSNNKIYDNSILYNSIGLWLISSLYNTISKNSFENNIYNLLLEESLYNHISYNNFKYSYKILNVISLYSNNIWVGNFWNKPRILPVRIWNYKTTKNLRFIIFLPYSMDIDWRPAKKLNNINNTWSDWSDFKVNISKDSFFLKIFKKLPFFEGIISRIMNF